MSTDSSKPYWNGERCVSCAAGTKNAAPFLDGDQCVSECSNGQVVSADDTKCVTYCENGYILVNSYGIIHQKCKKDWFCRDEGGYEYDDQKS